MRYWILISTLTIGLLGGSLGATQKTSKQLGAEGHELFMEVLAGDQSRLPEVIRLMEEARKSDAANIDNLYNLGRVHFYEVLTFNKQESLVKAEEVFATILKLDPKNSEALSFHGAVLTALAQGRDIPKFMQGVQEMKAAIAMDPRNINNRIVLPLTALNFPPQALAAMGNYDPATDLEIVSNAFNGGSFHYAPHADAVMKAFVADAYMRKGDKERAKKQFEAALAVAKPEDAGAAKGREVLDRAITARMNGTTPQIDFGAASGCHSCHLTQLEKLKK